MHTRLARATLALAMLTALAAPFAHAETAAQTADARYKAEVARCNSGQSQEDRATCLREAGAARDEARKGNLSTPAGGAAASNATDRCKLQPVAEQKDCIQRITGNGPGVTITEGSVAGGGVIRETITPVKP